MTNDAVEDSEYLVISPEGEPAEYLKAMLDSKWREATRQGAESDTPESGR